MKSRSLTVFLIKKKLQILFQKSHQFINVVNGVNRSHKTAHTFFNLTQLHSLLTGMYRSTRRH